MQDIIASAYQSATKRLFLLDYDGNLRELQPTPDLAKPTPEIITLLTRLGSTPGNTVVLISGRKHEEMEAWFGGLPLHMMAEHGLLQWQPGQGWHPTVPVDVSWKYSVQPIMDRYVSEHPGSWTEEKTNGLVWHYRNAATATDSTLQALVQEITPIATHHNLKIMPGTMIIEVQPYGFDKGTAATHWLNQDHWDFIFASGDDTTDEDMLKVIPEKSGFTVHVGSTKSVATYNLATPAALRAALTKLI